MIHGLQEKSLSPHFPEPLIVNMKPAKRRRQPCRGRPRHQAHYITHYRELH